MEIISVGESVVAGAADVRVVVPEERSSVAFSSYIFCMDGDF